MFTQFNDPVARLRFLSMRGIRFNEGGGDGSGAGGEGGGDGGEQPQYTAPATQADLDRIVEGRIARERQKLAGEYGGDVASVKAMREEFEAYKQSQKTESEKAIDEARKTAETEVAQRFLSKLVSSEAKAIAATLGFNDPADALAVVADVSALVKDEEPDSAAIKAAIEKLATDKPYLLKADAPKVRTRPKPTPGEQRESDGDSPAGKGKAAAALRQLAATRKAS